MAGRSDHHPSERAIMFAGIRTLHAALLERFKRVREGADVLIRYTGKQTSKAGRVFKGFEVFVADETALREPGDDRPIPA
jgi:hypothetical protein